MRMQPFPERILGLEVPGDCFGISQRGLLARAVAIRGLEIQELEVIVLDHPSPGRLDRALVPAVLALDRFGDVDAAELFDAVIEHSVVEHVAPRLGEGPEDGRHVGSDRLTLRARSALASTPLQLFQDLGIFNRSWTQIADPLLGHKPPPLAPRFTSPVTSRSGALVQQRTT